MWDCLFVRSRTISGLRTIRRAVDSAVGVWNTGCSSNRHGALPLPAECSRSARRGGDCCVRPLAGPPRRSSRGRVERARARGVGVAVRVFGPSERRPVSVRFAVGCGRTGRGDAHREQILGRRIHRCATANRPRRLGAPCTIRRRHASPESRSSARRGLSRRTDEIGRGAFSRMGGFTRPREHAFRRAHAQSRNAEIVQHLTAGHGTSSADIASCPSS